MSPALARELAAKPDDTLVIRLEKPSALPLESLHGRKDEAGATLRVSLREILPAEQMGEFALQPQQGAVRAVFVSLAKLQKNLGQEGKANTILLRKNELKSGSYFYNLIINDNVAKSDKIIIL